MLAIPDRTQPWRSRLLPWQAYAVIGVAAVVLVGLVLFEVGFESDQPARALAVAVLLPMALGVIVFAYVARRYQHKR